jgi:hypothetical protein
MILLLKIRHDRSNSIYAVIRSPTFCVAAMQGVLFGSPSITLVPWCAIRDDQAGRQADRQPPILIT